MKTYPMLFSTPMVQSTMEKIKTQTRRTKGLDEINENPDDWEFVNFFHATEHNGNIGGAYFRNLKRPHQAIYVDYPYGPVGSVIWVREKFAARQCNSQNGMVKIEYAATPDLLFKFTPRNSLRLHYTPLGEEKKWTPSIHMPKDIARNFLQVKTYWIQRLLSITEEDAIKEGVRKENYFGKERYMDYLINQPYFKTAKKSFFSLWELINENLKDNPFVWIIEYETIDKPVNFNN